MQPKTLAQLNIGANNHTFIIAEAGINHNGDLGLALKLVDEAKQAGADAIKFQTYITEKRVAKDNPVFGILKQCELSTDQQKQIKNHADRVGIVFFSTPFDVESVNFLLDLNVALFKIASFDIVNEELLDAVAKTGLPIIMSRGMANAKEIDRALEIFKARGSEYALLHCISSYPTPKEAVNLNVISSLKKKYDCIIGYSDHTLDIDASVYAVAAGARIIEKHFTLDRNMAGPDQKMSVDPAGLAKLCKTVRDVEVMLGSGEIQPVPVEEGAKIYRRYTKI